MKLLVNLWELRRALLAVMPHVTVKEGDLSLVRLTFTPAGVDVQASSGATLVVAHASAADAGEDAGLSGAPFDDSVELTKADAASVLATFRPPSDELADADVLLSVSEGADGRVLTVVEVAGFVDGPELRLPLPPRPGHFPNVPLVLATRFQSRPVHKVAEGGAPLGVVRMLALSDLAKRFDVAGKVYNDPLAFQAMPGHRAVLVTCGEMFAGCLIAGADEDETWHKDVSNVQEAHVAHLGPLGAALQRDTEQHRAAG